MHLLSKKFFPIFTVLVVAIADNTPSNNYVSVCRLYNVIRDNKYFTNCCSPGILETSDSLCYQCKEFDNGHVKNSSIYISGIVEYNFILRIMNEVSKSAFWKKKTNKDSFSRNDFPWDMVCPTIKSMEEPLDTQLFLKMADHPNVNVLVTKTVNIFSNDKICEDLPNFNALTDNNQEYLKSLLGNMLHHIYTGVPYCERALQEDNFNIEKLKYFKMKPMLQFSEYPLVSEAKKIKVAKSSLTEGDLQSNKDNVVTYLPSYRAWIATIVAILIISFVSVSLIALFGARKNIRGFRYILEAFVASAVAALLTDSLLHLYPHALGIHDHEHHTHDEHHDHQHESIYSSSNFLWKGIILITTIYVFYLIEYLMLVLPKFFGGNVHHHHHHHHHHDHFHHPERNNKVHSIEKQVDEPNQIMVPGTSKLLTSTTACQIECHVDDHIAQHRLHAGVPMECIEHIQEAHAPDVAFSTDHTIHYDKIDNNDSCVNNQLENKCVTHDEIDTTLNQQTDTINSSSNEKTAKFSLMSELRKIDKVVWMLTLGDALHNCIDGLIIGTQFMEPWPDGFSKGIMTSIAILCHEVPHEVGDYAAMIASGLSIRKAILINSCATVTCLIGGLIGCGLGTAVRTAWIEPVVAGIFIYISLSILMPNLVKALEIAKKPFYMFLCHTIGYLFGATCLIAIAFHESSFSPH